MIPKAMFGNLFRHHTEQSKLPWLLYKLLWKYF